MYVRSSSSARRLRTHECLRCHSSIIKLHHALWGCRLERREPGEVYLGSLPSSPPASQTVIYGSLSALQVPLRIQIADVCIVIVLFRFGLLAKPLVCPNVCFTILVLIQCFQIVSFFPFSSAYRTQALLIALRTTLSFLPRNYYS